ncbi:hypothetical protein DFH06DRAFT_1486295 [Mycena polygramma]|nr:hypothetical protein DFH06DRAFT_1486295 [Mycena polygramma]
MPRRLSSLPPIFPLLSADFPAAAGLRWALSALYAIWMSPVVAPHLPWPPRTLVSALHSRQATSSWLLAPPSTPNTFETSTPSGSQGLKTPYLKAPSRRSSSSPSKITKCSRILDAAVTVAQRTCKAAMAFEVIEIDDAPPPAVTRKIDYDSQYAPSDWHRFENADSTRPPVRSGLGAREEQALHEGP